MKKLIGTGVALVTPFTESLEVDYKALKKLLAFTGRGVDYYVVMGTTGESATCSDEEKASVLAFIKKNNPRKLPIVYGIGGNNTQHVLDEVRATDFSGVDALLSVSPYYNRPSQEGIARHFEVVAEKCPVPVILYNIPARTGSNLTADTTLRLSAHRNIIGIKEASGSLEQCMRIAKDKPREFMLISGDDLMTAAIYAIGGSGVISVLANAYPMVFKKLKNLSVSGKHVQAAKEQFGLLDINGPMYEEANPVGIKALLNVLGICSPQVRLPLVQASDALYDKISRIHKAVKK
jgi:4-hydroxy-tetrahydrodipicolinate synthase